MKGRCLCGHVAFEVDACRLALYRCHCTLCRRQSGTASNCAAIVPSSRFRWLGGADSITSWRKPSGYRSDFCAHCGSPVPNPLLGRDAFWVPAGLLDDTGTLEIVADFHLASRAAWDAMPVPGRHFDDLPADEFFAIVLDE